jgi:WD40 repeat protein
LKVGEDRPLFTSPLSAAYLTAGAWSSTRPAVLFIASADGNILVWDFTDSSFHPSIELKATHAKITSMEIYTSHHHRHQLLAVGDEAGTLHIFEMPRNLTKAVHKEEATMLKFLERELQVILSFNLVIYD